MSVSSTTENLEQVVSTVNNVDLSIMTLILSADPVGKLVILILVLASIWSWGIIINKLINFNGIRSKMFRFENLFWSGQVLDDLYEKVKKSIDNPLSSVFVNALNECKKHKSTPNTAKSDSLKIGYKDRVIQAMYLAKNREMERLESKLSFLATVGSSAPFIGLFGTVWGIMHSFQSIAASKNTTLAVVAPGIAEALLATAIGLFAAIPAVIFYNFLASSVDNIHNRTDDFIGELTALLTRAIDEEKM
jgi:biopolymer transport protein TolQ